MVVILRRGTEVAGRCQEGTHGGKVQAVDSGSGSGFRFWAAEVRRTRRKKPEKQAE